MRTVAVLFRVVPFRGCCFTKFEVSRRSNVPFTAHEHLENETSHTTEIWTEQSARPAWIMAASKHRDIVVEPHSTREIEMILKLIIKVPGVGNTADTSNPLGINPYYRKFGSPHGPEHLAPVG